MKKISTAYVKRFPPLRLYREDLDQLLAIFQRNNEKVAITAGDYELSGSADFDELKRRTASAALRYFKLQTAGHSCPQCPSSHEWLSLTLSTDSARLYISDEADTQLLGMAGQIESFLRSRRTFISYAATPWVAYTVLWAYNLATCATTLPILASNIGRLSQHGFQGVALQFAGAGDVLASFLPLLTVLSYFSWAMYMQYFRHSIVYLAERGAMPGFIRRNKDQIVVGIVVGTVCAVIGAIVGALLTMLLAAPKH